jgi:hypothetical protein
MLIIYRTNAGFEGQIQDVQENGYGPIFDALVQQKQIAGLPWDLAYIEVDVLTVPAAQLTDLWLNRSRYTVDLTGPTLLCDGEPVYSADTDTNNAIPAVVTEAIIVGQKTPAQIVSWAGAAPIAWPGVSANPIQPIQPIVKKVG